MHVLVLIGLAFFLAEQLWFVVEGFRQSAWWGIGMLVIPFVSLMFLVRHWARARWPFIVELVGLAICVAVKVAES